MGIIFLVYNFFIAVFDIKAYVVLSLVLGKLGLPGYECAFSFNPDYTVKFAQANQGRHTCLSLKGNSV